MSDQSNFNSVASFLWSIADLLNGAFKKSDFQKIILPFTVLRRLDYALESTQRSFRWVHSVVMEVHEWVTLRLDLDRYSTMNKFTD